MKFNFLCEGAPGGSVMGQGASGASGGASGSFGQLRGASGSFGGGDFLRNFYENPRKF